MTTAFSNDVRALWFTGPGTATLRSDTIYSPVAGEIFLVRSLYSAVSEGTERLVLAGKVPPNLHQAMRVPYMEGDFSFPVKYGYSLVGGRLLPGESGPAAQFMYQNAAGARLTIYIAAVSKDATAFRLFRNGNRSTFYWGSQGTGCALTGQVSTVQLRSMAIDACSMLGRAFRSRETGDGLNP